MESNNIEIKIELNTDEIDGAVIFGQTLKSKGRLVWDNNKAWWLCPETGQYIRPREEL